MGSPRGGAGGREEAQGEFNRVRVSRKTWLEMGGPHVSVHIRSQSRQRKASGVKKVSTIPLRAFRSRDVPLLVINYI